MLKQDKIYYAHFNDRFLDASTRRDGKTGYATVAVRVTGAEVRYAVAWCSPKDQFARRHGRDLAAVRLDSGECAAILGFYPQETMKPYELCALCLRIDLNSETAPSWADQTLIGL